MSEETQNARVELDDALSTWTHRLSRYQSKQTTQNSVFSALTDIINPATVFLRKLSEDPAGLEDDRCISLVHRARKPFEIWQNEHDGTYRMPEIYKKLQEFCNQHSRFKGKNKGSSGGPATQGGGKDSGPGNGPSGGAGATSTTATTNSAPPSKKRRRKGGNPDNSQETNEGTEEPDEEASIVAPDTMVIDDSGPAGAIVIPDDPIPNSAISETTSAVQKDSNGRAETVRIPYALVPGMNIGSRTYLRAVQLLTNPRHVRFASWTAERIFAIAKEIEPLTAKNQELFHDFSSKCDNPVVQIGLLQTSSELVGASQSLEAAARRYEVLAKQQETLFSLLKPASVKA